MKRILTTLTILLLIAVTFSAEAQKARYNDLREAIFSARNLRGDNGPSNVNWINDGSQYSFTRFNNRQQEIWIHDIKTGEEELIFTSEDRTFEGSEEPFRYRTFAWTADYKYILFQTRFNPVWRYSGNSDYYLYSIEDDSLDLVVEQAFSAEISPDGKQLGYGKNGDLFMYTFYSGETTRFTDDAAAHFYNGRFGWAQEEEFGLVQGWKWSNDSRFIAFWQTDERNVPIYKLTDFSEIHPEYMEVPYPKVGDPIPGVKLGVINVSNGQKQWLNFDLEDGYIPRIYWTSKPGILAVVYMNRPQNYLQVSMVNVMDQSRRIVYEENSESWIDIFDFFSGELDHFYFPDDMDDFFFVSERDGWAHIYSISYDGKKVRQITEGNYEVIGIQAINTKKRRLYYVSTEVSPLEHHLYSIKFNGRNKKQITMSRGNHSVDVSPDGSYYFDRYSSVDESRKVEFSSTDGKVKTLITDNSTVSEYLEQHVYAPRELFTFTTEAGHQLDGYIIKPVDFDPEKTYPLLLSIYGGPGSQGVYNTFESNGFHQYLAQEGFVIANVNNRGNGGYGSAFEKSVYRQLGKLEAEDFVATAMHLAEQPWIDSTRMAIQGHSYGGFMSSYTMVNHPGIFKAAIVAAPNADHRLYDCILTERLMGLLEDNEVGYEESAVSSKAANLDGEMLLVHSLMDENVHPQHTFQLVNAFIQAGKDVDLKIYPPGDHGVAYDLTSYLLLMTQYRDFLFEHLKSDLQQD